MKVTRKTDDLLIFDHTPWLFAILLGGCFMVFVAIGIVALFAAFAAKDWGLAFFGVMFAGVGGFVWGLSIVLFVKRLQFIFDRKTGVITVRRRSVIGHREITFALQDLIRGDIEVSQGEHGATYRPVLVLKSGAKERVEPLHHYFTNGTGPQRVVEELNDWWGVAG